MRIKKQIETELKETGEKRYIGAQVDRRTADLTAAAVRILFGADVATWIRREADKIIEQAGLAKAQ